jgi:hypothetical protein
MSTLKFRLRLIIFSEAFACPLSHPLHLLLFFKETVGFSSVLPLLTDRRVIVVFKICSYFAVLSGVSVKLIHHLVDLEAVQIEHGLDVLSSDDFTRGVLPNLHNVLT